MPRFALSLVLTLIPTLLLAEPNKDAKDEKPPAEKTPLPEPSITHGKLRLAGGAEPFSYTATAGVIELANSEGKVTGEVFHVAYTAREPDASRPVVFCFNGGPGSSAVWLHMGALGPKRVVLPAKGTKPATPPFKIVGNPDSLLPHADLVFVDPVSTGFSRPETKEDKASFHGFGEDIRSTGEFIRLWITKNGRWGSPKVLLGESYGALRVAGLAGHLQDRHGMYLNGVVLLSGTIDFRTLSARGGNDLPYSAFLPHMAATAFYHGKLAKAAGPDVETVIRRAQQFAETDYAVALRSGDRLKPEQRRKVAESLSKLTSLPVELIEKADLRIDPTLFRKQLLVDSGQVIGRFDARVKMPARDGERTGASFDPSWDIAHGPYATAVNRYLRDTLKYETELPYEIIGPVHPWSYNEFENGFVNSSEDLRQAMLSNPALKLLVNCGHYDLATPPAGILYSVSQLELPEAIRKNVEFTYYEGGHMFYTNPAALSKLGDDLAAFLQGANCLPPEPKAKAKAKPKPEKVEAAIPKPPQPKGKPAQVPEPEAKPKVSNEKKPAALDRGN